MLLAISPIQAPFCTLPSSSLCKFYYTGSLRQLARHVSTKPSGRPIPKLTPARATTSSWRPTDRFVGKPTVLVEASNPLAYKLGLYTLGSMCFGYSVTNYWSWFYEPKFELSNFQKRANYVFITFMALCGAFALSRTRKIISRISTTTQPGSAARQTLMLRIETYPTLPIPGLRGRMVEVPVNKVIADEKLGIPGLTKSTPLPPTQEEKIAERIWMREQLKQKEINHRRYVRDGIYSLPFRQAGYWIGRAFHGSRELFSGDAGFVKLATPRGIFKIAKDFDWALDMGHAFDKVVTTVEEKSTRL